MHTLLKNEQKNLVCRAKQEFYFLSHTQVFFLVSVRLRRLDITMTNFSLRCHQVDHMSAKLPTDNLIECHFFFRQTNKVTGQSSFFFHTHTHTKWCIICPGVGSHCGVTVDTIAPNLTFLSMRGLNCLCVCVFFFVLFVFVSFCLCIKCLFYRRNN